MLWKKNLSRFPRPAVPFKHKTDYSDDGNVQTDNSNTDSNTAKVLLLGLDIEFIKQKQFSGIISSRYSVDLRAIDLAIHCLLNNLSTDQLLNEKGSLALQKAEDSLQIKLRKRNVLIGHLNSETRSKLREYFEQKGYSVEEANEGPKVVNFVRTMEDELFLLVISLNIPLLSCEEIIKSIKVMPNHRRARFIVTFANCEKKDLVPLVKLGVRDFFNEEISMDQIFKKFQEMGL